MCIISGINQITFKLTQGTRIHLYIVKIFLDINKFGIHRCQSLNEIQNDKKSQHQKTATNIIIPYLHRNKKLKTKHEIKNTSITI